MFYCEIISGLWCGDVELMNSKKFLTENDINVLLNCTIEYESPDHNDMIVKRLPFSEQLKKQSDFKILNDSLDNILTFIYNSLMNDKNILICCYDGLNVSALIIGLFIKKYGEIENSKITSLFKSKDDHFSLDYNLSMFNV
jgi:protein-tyrosine phosphatase